MNKHTPGPWYYAGFFPCGTGPAPHALLIGPVKIPLDRGHGWHIPDARLMAAAPELLAALRDLFADGAGIPYANWTPEQHAAHAAIAKATGEVA